MIGDLSCQPMHHIAGHWFEQQVYQRQSAEAGSSVLIPMLVDEQWIGCLIMELAESSSLMDPSQQKMLRLLVQMLVQAMDNERTRRLRSNLISMINHSRVVMMIYNLSSGQLSETPLFVSDSVSQWGYRAVDLVSHQMDWWSCLSPGQRAEARTRAADWRKAGKSSLVQIYQIRTADGEYRWVREERYLHKTIREPGHLHVILLDVTDEYTAHQELERQNAFIARVFDSMPLVLFTCDRSGHYSMVNQVAAELLGVDPAHAHEQMPPMFIHQPDGFDQECVEPIEQEFEIRSAQDQRWVWLSSTRVPVRMPNDELHLLFAAVDITEQKLVEQLLRRSEQKYRSFFVNARIGVLRISMPGCQIVEINPYAAELLGAEHSADLIGRDLIDFFAQGDRIRQLLDHAGRMQWAQDMELALSHAQTWVDVTLWRHQPEGMIEGIIADVSHLRRARQQAEAHRQELERLDRLATMGSLLAGTAHEINNPNQVVMLNSQLLQSIWEDLLVLVQRHEQEHGAVRAGGLDTPALLEQVPAMVQGLAESAERIDAVVRDMKQMARGETTGQPEPVDLNAQVRRAIKSLKPVIDRHTHCFEMVLAESLPMVLGRPLQLVQVVSNLVDNALQSLTDPSQAVVVTTSLAADQHVLLGVSDQGVGMTEEQIQRVMDPYYTTRRDRGGTGVGLSIVRRITDELNAEVQIVSEPNVGSSFTVRLMVCQQEVTACNRN